MVTSLRFLLTGSLTLAFAACGPAYEVPERYEFNSRFTPDQSSVAYSGQALRQTLIEDLKAHIGGLTDRIDSQAFAPQPGDVQEELQFFYAFSQDAATGVAPRLNPAPGRLQASYADFGANANLQSKIAGNDPEGQHQDWSTGFVGWPGASSPEGLVLDWFAQLDAAAVARMNGEIPTDPSGAAISKVYLTAQGQDLQQLIQKFLGAAVAFSQGTDDYLDDDLEGKGLNASNLTADGSNPYTPLEHHWDEAFGYFGAARDFGDRSDAEVAAAAAFDTDGDGKIDLRTEYTFGHAANASKRDDGSAASAPTDFSGEAFDAFLTGRAIIATAEGELDEQRRRDLLAQRDLAVLAWEKAIAASVVHYVNEVLVDMGKFGTAEYSFADHAKHWSELKGFALAFQFNPRSPMTDAQFATLHEKLGTAPALPGAANVDAYKAGLLEVKQLFKTAYGFADANLGDAGGAGGW